MYIHVQIQRENHRNLISVYHQSFHFFRSEKEPLVSSNEKADAGGYTLWDWNSEIKRENIYC